MNSLQLAINFFKSAQPSMNSDFFMLDLVVHHRKRNRAKTGGKLFEETSECGQTFQSATAIEIRELLPIIRFGSAWCVA